MQNRTVKNCLGVPHKQTKRIVSVMQGGNKGKHISTKTVWSCSTIDNAVWFQEHGTRLVATLPNIMPTDFKSRLNTLLAKREQCDPVSKEY